MERVPKKTATKADITKPVEILAANDDSCFGKEWDMGTNDCSMCADNLMCGIFFSERTLKKKVKDMEDKYGAFLDQVDFSRVKNEDIFNFVKSGITTVNDLIDFVIDKAKCRDEVAVVEWLKRFIKSNNEIYTKEGSVWLR